MNQFPSSGPGFGAPGPGMFPGRMRRFRVRGPAAVVVAVIAVIIMAGIGARAGMRDRPTSHLLLPAAAGGLIPGRYMQSGSG